jgi:hypothetical protein
MIETRNGQLARVALRPWPKLLSLPEIWPTGLRFHGSGPDDCCRLYYNQPRSMPKFLAVRYMVTSSATSFATFRAALVALDQIAAIKNSDAAVCDVANRRLTDRIMRRLGWVEHKPQRWHRNFIRRYYGHYPLDAQFSNRGVDLESSPLARNARPDVRPNA